MTENRDELAFQGNPNGNRFLMGVGKLFLRLFGWRPVGVLPEESKFVAVGAPHTSGWDLPLGIGVILSFGVKVYWMAKDSLFHPPLGWLLRSLGGIPIDRSTRRNVVNYMAETFNNHDQLIVALMPEGTRKRVEYWKTGFYYIASQAQVPMVPAFLDYKRKVGGIGPVIPLSGDIEADLEHIKAFFADITPRHPERFGEIKVRPRDRDR